MSTTAGLLLTALSGTAVTYNNTLSTLEKHNTRSTNKNCEHTNTQNTFSTELNLRLSRSSSQQNLDTDSGKSSCSPALLDSSFDSGIVVGAKHILKGEEMVECSVVEQQIDATSSAKSVKTESCAGNNTITTNCYNGIGTDTSSNAVEEMRQKLRNERLQQWRLILLELDRQGDPHRRLRERLSKVCERKIFKKGSTNDCICNVCCCQIDQSDSKSVVSCCVCNKKVCRGAKCSTWLPKPGCWECQLCKSSNHSLSHTQSWVAEQMSFNHTKNVYPMKARSEIYIPIGDCNESSMHFENKSHVGENCAITAGQKLKIREYVEEVVAKLLGGSLDQIRVNQLSKSENYLPGILNNSTLPQSTVIVNGNSSNKKQNVNKLPEFSEISQKRLRYMIESIISETLRMPPLANGSVSEVALNTYAQSNEAVDRLPLENGKLRLRHHYRTDNYFEPKIYQDLLATAVLNKIADKEGNIRQLSESTPDLSSRHIDSKFNLEKDSTSSGSSVEPRSDFSYTDTEQAPKIIKVPGRESALSDYIAGHKVPLPDLSAAATESEEEDHASVSSSIIAEGTWENNWLFKKKGSLSASLTGSVGMLVPAPKDDVRAQIGDKTADEISDLSEIGSDTDDSSLHIASGNLDHLNNRILSKHLIGGQNTKVVLDELIETASLVSNTPKMPNEPEYTEAKNEHILEATKKTEAINSTYSNEHIPLSGSIAEREYKKWNNAVEMPNNPYAPEALKRRISGSQERFIDLPNIISSTEKIPITLSETTKLETNVSDENYADIDYKRYSRDYYINNDKANKTSLKHEISTSTTNKSNSSVNDEHTADIVINESTREATETQVIEKPIEPYPTIYQALPAHVVEENASIETLSNQSMQSVNTTTSDDSDTMRIYDFKKQQTIIVRTPLKMSTTTSIESIPADYPEPTLQAKSTETKSNSIENLLLNSAKATEYKMQHPKDLPLESSCNSLTSIRTPITPTRGSTPQAFKFLQPKRKLIEPCQILSVDEGADALTISPPAEKIVVEEEVAQVMPSVKALAQAFLVSSNKSTAAEKRWKKGVKSMPIISPKSSVKQEASEKTEINLFIAEVVKDATITCDVSPLKTDVPKSEDHLDTKSPAALQAVATLSPRLPSPGPTAVTESNKITTTNALRRVSMLKSNIAFFENLKFK